MILSARGSSGVTSARQTIDHSSEPGKHSIRTKMAHNSSKRQHRDKSDDEIPLTISELEAIAQTKLRKQVWDYYVSGSDEQASARRNKEAYDKYVAISQHGSLQDLIPSSDS